MNLKMLVFEANLTVYSPVRIGYTGEETRYGTKQKILNLWQLLKLFLWKSTDGLIGSCLVGRFVVDERMMSWSKL